MVISNGFSDKDLSTPGDDVDDSEEGQWQEVGPKNRVTHVTREVSTSLIQATSLFYFLFMFLISVGCHSLSVCLSDVLSIYPTLPSSLSLTRGLFGLLPAFICSL